MRAHVLTQKHEEATASCMCASLLATPLECEWKAYSSQHHAGRSLSAGKDLPGPRLRDGDPRISCHPKTGILHHHQTWTAAVLLNQMGAKADKHSTLFMGSKYSPCSVIRKGNVTLHQSGHINLIF